MGTDLFIDLWMMAGNAPRMTYNITSPTAGSVITIQAPVNELSIAEGTLLSFTANATDKLTTDISTQIQWFSSLDGLLGTGATVTSTLSKGNHVVRAQISNSYGIPLVQKSQTVTVTGDQYPSLSVITPKTGDSYTTAGTTSATVNLAAIASEAEDGDINTNIQWQSNINGPLGSGSNINALLSTGSHIITLSITDSAGNVIQVSRDISVTL